MKKKAMRLLAFIVILAVMVPFAGGCGQTEQATQVVFSVGDKEVTLDEVWFYCKSVEEYYESYYSSMFSSPEVWTSSYPVEKEDGSTEESTLEDVAKLCDVFYIGGTKNGAMFGEALVLVRDEFKDHFRFNMKQHGAILAKGWMIGVQFEELFRDNLYLELGKRSVALAKTLKDAFAKCNIPLLAEAPTNQIFPILPDELAEKINAKYLTTFQCKPDEEHTCLRFCTSWATNEQAVEDFARDLENWTLSVS